MCEFERSERRAQRDGAEKDFRQEIYSWPIPSRGTSEQSERSDMQRRQRCLCEAPLSRSNPGVGVYRLCEEPKRRGNPGVGR